MAFRVLLGLAAGFGLGLALSSMSPHAAQGAAAVLAPVGTIFVNLIRMTVVPLLAATVVASLGGSTASNASNGLGRVGARAFATSVMLLVVAATGTLVIARLLLTGVSIQQSAVLALRTATDSGTQGSAPSSVAPTVASWIVDLVPANLIKAAADGALLPLILFSVIFGLALAHIGAGRRDSVLRVVEGIADAMQRIVVGVLALAPIGVFALAVPLASTLGWSAAGALITYVGLVVGLTAAAVALILYPLGIFVGGMSASAFASYCAPAQAIAFASRSSLAALPVMVQSAERAGLRSTAARVALPLAAALFHFGAAVAQTTGVVFLARLYGVALTPLQLASVVVAVVLASFAVPGIPGGSIIAMTPALAAANLPLEGLGILLAVDTIPDMFRTTANATGALTLTAMFSDSRRETSPSTAFAQSNEPLPRGSSDEEVEAR